MAAKKYKYVGTHPRDLPSGRVLAPGEIDTFDPMQVRDLVKEGLMIELDGEKEAATEAAIKLAQKNGVNLSGVKGTGKDGTITAEDVQAAVDAAKEGEEA